jgi:hypothetical protein
MVNWKLTQGNNNTSVLSNGTTIYYPNGIIPAIAENISSDDFYVCIDTSAPVPNALSTATAGHLIIRPWLKEGGNPFVPGDLAVATSGDCFYNQSGKAMLDILALPAFPAPPIPSFTSITLDPYKKTVATFNGMPTGSSFTSGDPSPGTPMVGPGAFAPGVICLRGTSVVKVLDSDTKQESTKLAKDVVKGDMVFHDSNGFIPVLGNIMTRYATEYYLFKKDMFGENMPSKDFYITGNHHMHINGKKMLAKSVPGGIRTTVNQEEVYTFITEEGVYVKINNLDVGTLSKKEWARRLEEGEMKNKLWELK